MPYTLQDFRQEYARQALATLTPEERLAGLAPEDILSSLSAKDQKLLAQLLLKEQNEGSSASDKE